MFSPFLDIRRLIQHGLDRFGVRKRLLVAKVQPVPVLFEGLTVIGISILVVGKWRPGRAAHRVVLLSGNT